MKTSKFGPFGARYVSRSVVERWKKEWGQGKTESQWSLTKLLRVGDKESGVQRDPEYACKSLKDLAKRGFAPALFDLAEMYQRGEGGLVASNEAAERLYLAAAKGGVVSAYYRLARLYGDPEGGPIREIREKETVDEGEKVTRGHLIRDDREMYEKYLEVGARLGDPIAAFVLGQQCFAKKTPVMDLRGFAWIEKSAEKEYAPAMHNLGDCYRVGRGVKANAQKAMLWFQRASDKGFAFSKMTMAAMYWKGDGVQASLEMAEKLYKDCLHFRNVQRDAQRCLDAIHRVNNQ